MQGAATKRERILANLARIRAQMDAAAIRAGRDAGEVRLIPVTKSVGIGEAGILLALGYTELGENRLEVALPKMQALGDTVRWHMIGHVQRRKARDVVAHFDRVDSVDRIDLATELEKRCAAADKVLPILIEVNVSGEESKSGFSPDATTNAVNEIREIMPHLRVEGLMTMAPFVDDPEDARPVFAGLRELGARLGLSALSMGMTNDFEVAIEEGATEVRIGTAIFEGIDTGS